ncbi:Pycsar system effector family protein [Foetidibacter luteolus]|uniref:Pycsar system effector family protein n=1 Tax=Foetidibacter luteolus TaxID=2608880 RepID=UPI00129B9EA0|nr:Pycsar system effector family protein [Foetidibacter luteolus]
MSYQKYFRKIERYVEEYFTAHSHTELVYHDFNHTSYVARAAEKILLSRNMPEEEYFIVMAAAWFHDTGYLHERKGHEKISSSIAQAYLEAEGFREPLVSKISELIMVTARSGPPENELEEILLDADSFHLGKKSFMEKTELLRREVCLTKNMLVEKEEWYRDTVQFMLSHQFYTVYAKLNLEDKKQENITQLKLLAGLKQPDQLEKGKSYARDPARAERSIETAVKIASQSNQRLSSLADNKAHILITVNSIILSAIITLVLRKLGENPYLALPTFLLLAVSLVTIVLAIITTRPTVSKGRFSKEDVEKQKTNLLFFGNYYNMQPEEYIKGMLTMFDEKSHIYHAIILDIYHQGAAIGRKYRYLRLAYNIFMWGLVGAVVAFVIAALVQNVSAG